MKTRKDAKRSGLGRRDFLKNSGAGLLSGDDAKTLALDSGNSAAVRSPVRFVPEGNLVRISDNLYLFHDTCNVYVLRDGHRALLIDFGSGQILRLLAQIGVTEASAILHTHYHRDQCQGDFRAADKRIPIHVPELERPFFDDAENLWRNRQVFHVRRNNNDFFSLTRNVEVSSDLRDYETFRWGPYELFILPTPGHTIGSTSLIASVDGKKTAFTGDLIHSPGKVTNLYDLEYAYGLTDAVDIAIHSLTRLRDQGTDLVCPSHGEPFVQPEAGITGLITKLTGFYPTNSPLWPLTIENRPYTVTPHLIASDMTTSSFYAIISDSGKALFVDYGAVGGLCSQFADAAPLLGRMRFIEHTVPQLKAGFGLKSVDVAMPSHMHYDHTSGFPYLTRHGTKVWCYENMKDVLEKPRGYNLGCGMGEPIPVDRTFRDGETFKWEEFEFQVYYSPGHTEYQMAMFGIIDGARVAFTGDAFFPRGSGETLLRHNIVFHNMVESDSHVRSMRTILDYEPNIIAPGHGKPFLGNRVDMDNLKARLDNQQKYFFDVIADRDCDFGLNPQWARLYPYQLHLRTGANQALELRVRNYRSRPMLLEAALALPRGWKASPPVVEMTILPRQDGSRTFTVTVPADWDASKPRVAFAADIRCDGKCLGQIADCVADIEFG